MATASAVGVPGLIVEMQFSGSTGAWTDITTDVLSGPGITVSYGIHGIGPADRVADTGTMNFALNNAQNNSAKLIGYYSPGHENDRSGFTNGIGVRMGLIYSGSTFYKFSGRLDTIHPLPGKHYSRQTQCTGVDWFDEAARHKLKRLGVIQDSTAASVIGAFLTTAQMARLPSASTLAAGQTEWPYALDTAFDESTTVLSELQRIAMSERGYAYIKGDTASGNHFVFEDARDRQSPAAASTLTSDTMVQMTAPIGRDLIYNRIKTTVHPRLSDGAGATTILYTLQGAPTVLAGSALIIEGQYTDPNQQATRVGATGMITPSACTDYRIGLSASDDSETDNFTVSASYGANTVRYSIVRSTGASNNAYVTHLQARGSGLYDFYPFDFEVIDETSSACYGQNVLQYDHPYESRNSIAMTSASYFLEKHAAPINVTTVGFVLNGSDARCLMALRAEPGSHVDVTETVSAVAKSAFINGITLRVVGPNVVSVEWLIEDRFDVTDYWILGTDTLGTGTVLGW